jgi:hypothetical protein
MAFGSVLTVVFALVTCGTVGAQTLPSVPCGLSSAKYPFRFNFVKGKLANSQVTRLYSMLNDDLNLSGSNAHHRRHNPLAAHLTLAGRALSGR